MSQDQHDPMKDMSLEQFLRSIPEHEADHRNEVFNAQEPEEQQLTLLRFEIGKQRYAVPGEQVREVISASRPTRLPGAPAYIKGIVIHRRQVVGVLDLERWLQLTPSPPDPNEAERIVLIEHGALLVGLCTSSLTQMITIPQSRAEALPPGESTRTQIYVRAIIEDEAGPILLLRVERLLEDAAIRD